MARTDQVWIAHYIYATADGETRTAMKSVTAPTHALAMAAASRQAPAEEFVVSVHAQSEEQMLGAVRHRVAALSDRSIDAATLEALYEGDDDDEVEDGGG